MAGNDFISAKHCRTCGIEKPHSEFYKAACCKDDLRGECKACVAAEQGMTGIETPATADNLEGVA